MRLSLYTLILSAQKGISSLLLSEDI